MDIVAGRRSLVPARASSRRIAGYLAQVSRWLMDPSRLQELKKKLINDKDLLGVWGFFLDHLGENVAFLDLGEQVRHPFLEEILPRLGVQMFPQDATVCQMRLVRLADQQFIH